MGTNYYLRIPKTPHCERCAKCSKYGDKEGYKQVHIGKLSAGHMFCFSNLYRNTYQKWMNTLEKRRENIIDEYDHSIGLEELLTLIELHQQYDTTYQRDYFEYLDEGYRFSTVEFS